MRGMLSEIVEVGPDGVPESEILVHDEQAASPALAYLLAHMSYPEFPVPVGVFRAIETPTYEELLQKQVDDARRKQGEGTLEQLLRGGATWEVGANGA